MKKAALSEVKDDLSRYLRLAEEEEVWLMSHFLHLVKTAHSRKDAKIQGRYLRGFAPLRSSHSLDTDLTAG